LTRGSTLLAVSDALRNPELDGDGTQPQRKALHAYLSDEAHEIWHAVAADHGVSVSALLEALAADLASDHSHADFEAVVRRARRVDAERRRR
jgi:hypothetical protein